MKVIVSELLRKLAGLIEDDTPEDKDIKIRTEKSVKIKTPVKSGPARRQPLMKKNKQGEMVSINQAEKPTASPKIKPSRMKSDTEKKWNTETKKDLMKDYMKDYRGTGKVNETNSPKNVYTKKLKQGEQNG